MLRRIRAGVAAAASALAALVLVAPSAHAAVLSVLPGSCGSQAESQPFARWGDLSGYTLVPGGDFEAGGAPWALAGAARTVSGNESYNVTGGGSRSLSLPAGGSATSPAACTSIYHPAVRFFVRNTGSATSHLIVQALYPGLLGRVQTATLGSVTGSSSWKPSPAMGLLVTNLLATVSLNQTTIAFRFVPADSAGAWSVDDVYLDPYMRG